MGVKPRRGDIFMAWGVSPRTVGPKKNQAPEGRQMSLNPDCCPLITDHCLLITAPVRCRCLLPLQFGIGIGNGNG